MRIAFFSLILFIACACTVSQPIDPPKISYNVKKSDVAKLTSPFSSLSREEMAEVWAHEFVVGKTFAKDLDFYRAITAFKRALIMLPETTVQRRLEIYYDIITCYYLAKKYVDVVKTFEESWLSNVSDSFIAYNDLLLILYDSYSAIGENGKSANILLLLNAQNDERVKKLPLSLALMAQDVAAVEESNQFANLMGRYKKKAKSPSTARTLNAILPGAGYLYVGQKHTAITSFILNGLFIAAAHHFYDRGDTAMGIILTGFEAGWYFGGINGAGIAAQQYNHAHFTNEAYSTMERQQWFPVLMLQYAF